MNTLSWNSIRALDGHQWKGFEMLCCQLADAERPRGSTFQRKGTPDSGVECFATLSDGSEWGWQAKFVPRIGDTQWSELDRSVKAALEGHPRLARYIVCVPYDLPDDRKKRTRSAKVRWDERVKRWKQWATEKGMSVEFEYWGDYQLKARLLEPRHAGKIWFWFDQPRFGPEWFDQIVTRAVKAAGARYTPKVHVGLPIADDFEAFGRSELFFTNLKAEARPIREALREFEYASNSVGNLDRADPAFTARVHDLLRAFSTLRNDPVGPLPLQELLSDIGTAIESAKELETSARDRERAYADQVPKETAESTHSRENPHRSCRISLVKLRLQLTETFQAVSQADELASTRRLLLSGKAGTGKSHLLCDIARTRTAGGKPTVLLMGQAFTTTDDPWTQSLRLLDLPNRTVAEFLGALEAAAQAASCRALILIDALNEGRGREIWPAHLGSFLQTLDESPWICVVLAVRSSYEDRLIPQEIRESLVKRTHCGFEDHEYDAASTYFRHYKIESPSAPLLSPEFRIPMFLKCLCEGLNARGDRRLPRGFHGVSSIFRLFLDGVSDRVATKLGLDPKTGFVTQALDAIVEAMLEKGDQRWLPRTEAKQVVDRIYRGADFESSVFQSLVSEGLLLEEGKGFGRDDSEEIVVLAYDRFADHKVAQRLIEKYLDKNAPEAAFEASTPLSFLRDWRNHLSRVTPGLLEALCILLPEHVGRELPDLVPELEEHWGLRSAFRESLVWRAIDAFSEATGSVINRLTKTEGDLDGWVDVLVTVATLSGHRLNAEFLDERLRKDAMPDRDSWWSTALHRTWRGHGAVRRLVDWAWAVSPSDQIEPETLKLASTALGWMLTTSTRFLRDRATQALGNLLTGRLEAAEQIIERFADVDDPYVTERVYAVAYGVAMRSHNRDEVGRLAQRVYQTAFAPDVVPAHILLRDYARGVVERGLYLHTALEIDPTRIRPPYRSRWPTIPSEEDIKPLQADWSRGARDSGDPEWSRNTIASSVMGFSDFARYVIGTDHKTNEWLSLRLTEPRWRSPEEQLQDFVGTLPETERASVEGFQTADLALRQALPIRIILSFDDEKADASNTSYQNILATASDASRGARSADELDGLNKAFESAENGLRGTLSGEHLSRFEELFKAASALAGAADEPRFDLKEIQRYVLWRVFDLGWTTERFGHFDRFEVEFDEGEATSAERMGKKYQWIAYHEIMALIADHFQFRRHFQSSAADEYDGPWQAHRRDIDPSSTIRETPGGTEWSSHEAAWWSPAVYEDWTSPPDHSEWVRRTSDLPKVQDLLQVTDSHGAVWLDLNGYFRWKQPAPPDLEPRDLDLREIWFSVQGYLVRFDRAETFRAWAQDADFLGGWMPDAATIYGMFLGEHGWSPACRHFEASEYEEDGWQQPGYSCPTRVIVPTIEYLREAQVSDCSVDRTYRLRLPSLHLMKGLGLRWSGEAADYCDAHDRLIAFDPTAHEPGASAFLVRRDSLLEYLSRQNLSLFWAVSGEKRFLPAGMRREDFLYTKLSGAFSMNASGPVGEIRIVD